MNGIANKFLLAGHKFMPEMHLENLVLLIVHVVHSPEIKKQLKSLCRQDIQILFTEMSFIKLVSNIIWLIKNQTI